MKSPKLFFEIFLPSSTAHPQLRNPPPFPRSLAYPCLHASEARRRRKCPTNPLLRRCLSRIGKTYRKRQQVQWEKNTAVFYAVVFEFYLWQSFLWQSKKEASKSYRDFWLSDVARKLFPTGFNFYGHLEDSHSGQISNQIYCARSKKTSHLLRLNLLAFLGVKF